MAKWMSGYQSEDKDNEGDFSEPEPRESSGKNQKSPKKRPSLDEMWLKRLEIFYAVLMVIGLILSFFFINLGGTLVGLAIGMCFQKEIRSYYGKVRSFYSEESIFNSAMITGLGLYLLISVPAFVIALAIGFGIMTVILTRAKEN